MKALSDVPILAKAGVKLSKRERNLELARKLYSTNGKHIIRKVIEIALQDGHPKQLEALKLCIDRVAPVSYFEKTGGAAGKPLVQVIVSQSHGVEVKEIEGETYDHEGTQRDK